MAVAATIPCPVCKSALAVEPDTEQMKATCPRCEARVEAYFFPALFRPPEAGPVAAEVLENSEASCFYHAGKQAVGVCGNCGRLVCALCSIDLGSAHLCPNCISSGKKKGKLTTLENHRVRWDSIALSLAGGGFLLYFFSIFLAPAAIYIAIRHWNSPGSLLGVSKTRFVLAILLALFQLGLYGTIIFIALTAPHPHR